MWRASVLTILPEVFPGPLGASLAGKAMAAGAWSLDVVDIRAFATDKHRTVDDTPAGGGPGMVMKADVLGRAIDATATDERPRLLLSPRGAPLTQARVEALARATPASCWSAAASKASTSASSRRAPSKRSRSAIMCCPAARSRPWR
jgi:tRNA (guanine-N1)-methyltransferase